jgi:hypothetical protein
VNIAKLACGGLLALIVSAACGGKSTQAGGSNTNWFATCSATAECGSGLECWCGICTSTCATECASGPAAATCEMPPASCTDPSKKSACAMRCTNDAACKSLGADATCSGSVCRKGSGSSGKVSCDDSSAEAYRRVQALIPTADQSCTSTADCTEFPGVSCRDACSIGVVSKAGAAALGTELAAIEKEVCEPFAAAGCVATIPPCVFPGTPTCVAGKCEHVIPGQDMGSGATCDERVTEIGDRLYAALGALDKSCNANADCTRIGPGDKCFTGCETYPVSTKAASGFVATRAAVDRELCDAYLADGCEAGTFFGCPRIPNGPPQCIDGTCTDVFTTSDGGAGATCADRTTRMATDAEGAALAADHACSTSADCKVTMLVNECFGGCTYEATSNGGAQTLDDALSAMASRYCGDFSAAGCTVTRLPCVSPPTATCRSGKCALP